jgi:hypothetical protein
MEVQRQVSLENLKKERWVVHLYIGNSLIHLRQKFLDLKEEKRKRNEMVYYLQLCISKYKVLTKKKAPKFNLRLMMDVRHGSILFTGPFLFETRQHAKKTIITTFLHFKLLKQKYNRFALHQTRVAKAAHKWIAYRSRLRSFLTDLKIIWSESLNLYLLMMRQEKKSKIPEATRKFLLSVDSSYYIGNFRDKTLGKFIKKAKEDYWRQMDKHRLYEEVYREERRQIKIVNMFMNEEEKSEDSGSENSFNTESSHSSASEDEMKLFRMKPAATGKKVERKMKKIKEAPTLFVLPDRPGMVAIIKQAVQEEALELYSP